MTATDDAFRWARIYAVRHMAACEQAGLRWGETSITEIVTAQASWAVTVVRSPSKPKPAAVPTGFGGGRTARVPTECSSRRSV